MKKLLLILCLAVSVLGQTTITGENILSIKKFGGLNTRSSDFEIAPNEFRQLDEIDLNRNLGALTKRFGYSDEGTVPGADSIIGIYGAYFSDGRQRLFYVVDSTGVGYGNVYATPMNGVSGAQTRVATEWPVINKPQFAIYQDKVYITNSNGRSLVYDNEIARDFPLYAPGEPKIVPLNTSGNLKGEYVYLFAFRETKAAVTFAAYYTGDPSQRIKVKNGQALLKNFTWITGTSDDATPDSIMIRIYRTKANPGILDEGDTAYWVGTDIVATSKADLATKTFTDNIADGSLSADSFVSVVSLTRVGVGGVTASPRYGSLWQISDGNTGDSGVTKGQPAWAWGYSYMTTILDTATNLESPMSPPYYWQTQFNVIDSLVLGIPNPPSTTTGYRINLYRSLVVYSRWDTTWQSNIISTSGRFRLIRTGRGCVKLPNGETKCYLSEQPYYDPGGKKDSVYNLGHYYLIAQLKAGDTLYYDTEGHDSITSNSEGLYDPSFPLSPLEGIVSLEDRLFGFYGSSVAFSRLDTASRWFVFDRASVGVQDGQRITAIWGQRDALRIGKTNSLHNFYQTADTIWNLSEVTHHIGVIAPSSVAQGLGGTYYYTNYGIMRENEGLYRDRQFGVEQISQKVAALDSLPVSQKENAVGIYYNQMYMLSLPSLGDSGQTYVYFEKADAIARWPNLCFGGATLYSTDTALSFLPGDTLYFFKPGDSRILRFGVQETDGNNLPIQVRVTSAPLLTDDMNLYKQINRIGIIANATVVDTLTVQFKDEEGTQVSSNINFLDLRTKYQVNATNDGTFGRYLQYILTNQSGNWAGDTRIEGIELFWNVAGQNNDN